VKPWFLLAVIPAFLVILTTELQMAISGYDNRQDEPFGTPYEIRWLVNLGIYLAYLAGLASFRGLKRFRRQVTLAFTANFALLSIGTLSDSSSIGGGLAQMVGEFLNLLFGVLLLALVTFTLLTELKERRRNPRPVEGSPAKPEL